MQDDNPYQTPQTATSSSNRRATGDRPKALRRSLAYFGLASFLAHCGIAPITDRLAIDVFAILIFLIGVGGRGPITPWVSLLFVAYPIMFVAGVFSTEVATLHFWLIPTRGKDPPHFLYLVLAIWAVINGTWIVQPSCFPRKQLV